MKQPDRKCVVSLEDVPNVGPAIARLLRRAGVSTPDGLAEIDPYNLYFDACEAEGKRIDPCVLDVFLAAAEYMRGGEAKPWWAFTAERKARLEEMGKVS